MKNNLELIFLKFNGEKYPARSVCLYNEEISLISVEPLNEVLLKDGSYISSEARALDEQITFFVPPEMISCTDNELRAYVNAAM